MGVRHKNIVPTAGLLPYFSSALRSPINKMASKLRRPDVGSGNEFVVQQLRDDRIGKVIAPRKMRNIGFRLRSNRDKP
jgi:hypothetical protein